MVRMAYLEVQELMQSWAEGLVGQQLHQQVQRSRCTHRLLAQLVIVGQSQQNPPHFLHQYPD